jgi:hypothetical protein
MQPIKIVPLWIIIPVWFTFNSCSNDSKQKNNGDLSSDEHFQEQNQTDNQQNGNWEKLVPHEMRDKNGTLIATIPFPASWKKYNKKQSGDPSFVGPHGIAVKEYPLRFFSFPLDRQLQFSFQQSGQAIRDFPGIESFIKEDLIPVCNQQGLTYVGWKELPEITAIDKWYSDQLYKAVPGNQEVMALGTDWQTSGGDPYFLIVHLNVSTTAQMRNWSYWVTSLEADASYFEKAKKQLLFGIANVRYELEPIMAYNQSEAEKAGQSWAAHNRRMAQNQANFEASQRAHINRTEAINNAIMDGWRQRNASSDQMHEQFIDVINEKTNVMDESGNRYKVSSGYNHYWMNNDGEYISTDKIDYNPNLDDNMNGQKWQELRTVK